MKIRNIVAAATISVASIGMAVPSASAAPIVTGGLVNVTVTDVANNILRDSNVAVGAALSIAANVCDTNVNVLARQLRTGSATCTNPDNGSTATISQVG